MDPVILSTLAQSRALCPFLKRTPAPKLRALVRQYSAVAGGNSRLVDKASQCPYMSQALATSERTDSNLSLIHI